MMAEQGEQQDIECKQVLAAIARGGNDLRWEEIERHLATCAACAPGLERLTMAIQEQFAASGSLEGVELGQGVLGAAVTDRASTLEGRTAGGQMIEFPAASEMRPARRSPSRRKIGTRVFVAFGAVAAALVLLVGAVSLLPGSSAGNRVTADRRPEFVPSLDLLPSRTNHTYYTGEQVRVCLRINQPSRVHLSVLEGHTTFDLYDADTPPGEHCFPEQVGTIRGRAILRVEVFFGAERVAREDFVLLPAAATPAP